MFNNNNGYSLADIAAATGNRNNDGFGFGGDSGGWFFLLFILFLMGGWNNNGYGWGGNGNGAAAAATADVQRGFDQSAIINGINSVTAALNTGFANAEISRCNSQANVLQTLNNNQANLSTQLNTIAMNQQNCCCQNRAGLADLKYTVATEACADRNAVTSALFDVTAQGNANTNALMMAINNGFQGIKDQMCQDKIDAKDTEIANLRTQLNMQNLAASQTAQTAQLIADNAAQTQYVVNRVAPYPQPAIVYGYNTSWINGNGGCGCNNNGFYN